MKNLVCPISSEKVDENVVRLSAFFVLLLILLFISSGSVFIPLFLSVDFYIRAFTKLKYSPISWIAFNLSRVIRLKKNPIDKAPKLFAARIGLLFSIAISVLAFFDIIIAAELLSGTLFLFAFLECGVNFCAGCWVYTYVVVPFVKDR